MTRLDELLTRFGARCLRPSTRPAARLTVDSRKVDPNTAFAAGPGATPASAHGARFIPDALAANAPCLLVEDAAGLDVPEDVGLFESPSVRAVAAKACEGLFGFPSTKLAVVGITGTNGKTTTSFVLAHLLANMGVKAAVFGTLGIGDPAAPDATGFTTPEAEVVSERLHRLVDEGFEVAAMEVSSHALALGRVDGISFAAGAFTNLSHDHLDFHESMEAYRAAKLRLFRELLAPRVPAVVPVHDAEARAAASAQTRMITWGLGEGDVHADNIEPTANGIRFALTLREETRTVDVPLFGAFNVENILVACACALAVAREPDEVFAALSTVKSAPGRFERVGGAAQQPVVIVDYAHTPAALERALRTARGLLTDEGRLWAVFGCGGARDAEKRPAMGEVAARGAEFVVITDDNPRHEDPMLIRAAIRAGAQSAADVREEGDRAKAIALAVGSAGPKDVVLIAGKGHETTQTRADQVVPFDDRQVAAEALAARGAR